MAKIPSFTPVAEVVIRCKKCNYPHHQRHGCYFRKATHRRQKPIKVIRYLCLSCRGSFGVLPQDLLPVMRWSLGSIRHAVQLLKRGSRYKAAQIMQVTLGVMLRLSKMQSRLLKSIQLLGSARDMDEPSKESSNIPRICAILRAWTTWTIFVRELSLVLYPLLHKASPIPQQM